MYKTFVFHTGFDDVAYQGRFLLNNFVFERMQRDGVENASALLQLQELDRGGKLIFIKHEILLFARSAVMSKLLQEMCKPRLEWQLKLNSPFV